MLWLLRRFLGQFAIPARITDDAGVQRRVFNPWGPLSDMETDVRPIADVVVTDIVSSPRASNSHGLMTGIFINSVPQVWNGLNRAGLLPPMPDYFVLAIGPASALVIWWILATDRRHQVAPRLFLYGRCACCCYRLRENIASDQAEALCPECGACWKISRFGGLKEPPRMIGEAALEYCHKGVFDADWNYRPVPNLRSLRQDPSLTFARDAWDAGTDARFFTTVLYGIIAIGYSVCDDRASDAVADSMVPVLCGNACPNRLARVAHVCDGNGNRGRGHQEPGEQAAEGESVSMLSW